LDQKSDIQPYRYRRDEKGAAKWACLELEYGVKDETALEGRKKGNMVSSRAAKGSQPNSSWRGECEEGKETEGEEGGTRTTWMEGYSTKGLIRG